MIKQFVATFAAVAAIGIGSAAMAEDAMQGDAMHSAAAMPTMVCRAATSTDKSNAMMGQEGLMCKKFDFTKAKEAFTKAMMASPSSTPTQAQIDAAWQKAFSNAYLLGLQN